jgi:hypothetical protein
VKESISMALEAALELADRAKVDEILAFVRSDAVGRRMRFYQAHAARIEARSPDRTDDEAERLFEESIGAFRQIQMPFRTAVGLLEYGEWLDERARAADAAPLVAEGRSIFEGLGAQPWVERADRVMQAVPATS